MVLQSEVRANDPDTRREVGTVGLATLGLLLLLTRGPTVADAALHLDTAEGLWARGSTALSFDPGQLVVTTEPLAGGLVYMDEAGVVRSSQSPGMALLALPLVAVGSAVAELVEAGPLAAVLDPLFVDDGQSYRALLQPVVRDPRAIALSLLGPLSGAASLVFVWLALSELGVDRRRRAWVVAALFISPLGVYAGTCWTQPITAAALALATWTSARAVRGTSPLDGATGLALAIAVLVRPDHLLVLPAFVLTRSGLSPKRLAALLGPSIAVVGGLALHGLPRPAGGYALETLPIGLPGLLVSPLSGLLVYAPFVALAPRGFARAEGRLRWLALVPVVQLMLYGGWFDWDATLALGPRFVVPSLPVLALFVGLAPSRWLPRLTALGLALNLPAHLLAHARVPETHAFFQPAFVDAWRVLLGAPGEALGPLGIDCASTYTPFYAWAALAVGVLGLVLTRR